MSAYVHPLSLVNTVCECCGAVQPMINGLGNGRCKVCYHGRLKGWSWMNREKCGYKGCDGRAIAAAPRVNQCCAKHYPQAYKRPMPDNSGGAQ